MQFRPIHGFLSNGRSQIESKTSSVVWVRFGLGLGLVLGLGEGYFPWGNCRSTAKFTDQHW